MGHSADWDNQEAGHDTLASPPSGREGGEQRRRLPVRWSTLAALGWGSAAILVASLIVGLGILRAPDAVPEAVIPSAAIESVPEAVEALPPMVREPLAEALPAATLQPAPAQPAQGGQLVDEGIASTYGVGDDFQGRRTACGQVFDTHFPQAAHKTLPCGALIRVVAEESGRAVITKVTDRGPFVPGRVVDLSMAAYRQLDPRGQPGLLNVRVYRLPSGSG